MANRDWANDLGNSRNSRPPSRAGAASRPSVRSHTCSPTRGERHRTFALPENLEMSHDEVMKTVESLRHQAVAYSGSGRPASASSRLIQPPAPSNQAGAPPRPASQHPSSLTHVSYPQALTRPSSRGSLVSQLQHGSLSTYPSAQHSHITSSTVHQHHHRVIPLPRDATAYSIDPGANGYPHQQPRKVYGDLERSHTSMKLELEHLQRTVRERDDAVTKARLHSQSVSHKLVMSPVI